MWVSLTCVDAGRSLIGPKTSLGACRAWCHETHLSVSSGMLYFHERASDTSIPMSSPTVLRRDSRAGDSPPEREVDVLRRALALVEQRLPTGWKLAIDEEVRLGDLRVDALVELQVPDGSRTVLVVEAKRELATRDVANALEQLELASERLDRQVRAQPMLIAPYLGASTGATYRVVEFLEQEALIERRPRGQITTVDWRALLERWSEDYSFQASNTVVSYLAPRGLSALVQALRGAPELRYVLTGSLAAERFAPCAPSRLAAVYVDRLDQAAERLDLREVDAGANVLLATGDYDVVFERAQDIDGLRIAAPSQVAVDLLTAPGRGPAEGQALLDWMEANESAWRR